MRWGEPALGRLPMLSAVSRNSQSDGQFSRKPIVNRYFKLVTLFGIVRIMIGDWVYLPSSKGQELEGGRQGAKTVSFPLEAGFPRKSVKCESIP